MASNSATSWLRWTSAGRPAPRPSLPSWKICIPFLLNAPKAATSQDSARMSKGKPLPGGHVKENAEPSLVRSSAAEYLTFVAASGKGNVDAIYADENVWLTQKMMGLVYDVETHT